uniref:Regulator of G protein signaling 12b n=1 Tax=Myripristis murdjan TaxID=586833 RepID=A0A668AS82_9TELE
MFRQSDASSKRRPCGGSGLNLSQPPPSSSIQQGRIRAVEVARGRTGYGFTLSGQSPCVLSCILKGSPADYVGLRSGDHILSVNDINVSKASHEDVVKLIGRCSGVLKLVIAEGEHHRFHDNGINNNNNSRPCSGSRGGWYKPKLDSKQLGINRAEKVVAELQSGGIFNMIFENSSHSSSSSDKDRAGVTSPSKSRPLSEPEFPPYRTSSRSRSNPNLLSEEEMARVLNDDSVFLDPDFRHLHLYHPEEHDVDVGEGGDLGLEPSEGILNVGMMVGYLGSIELASTGTSLENDSLQAIRGSMRRLRAEQKIHSLVLMKVMHDSVRLCSDRGQVLATYPAEKLAFSACCPDDRRFFGLVTMQATDDHDDRHYGSGREEGEGGLRTSCHVFIVDPDLCHHQVHLGVARRFGFECTPDPDTGGCLEFPPTSQPLLQFVSVLYRDMGDNIEGVRARAFHDPDNDAQQNHSTSSNSDSGIGNFLPEEKNNRVLLVDLGGPPNHISGPRHWDSPPPSQQAWSPTQGATASHPPPPPPPLRNGHYRHEPHLADLPHPLPLRGGAVGGGDKRGGGGVVEQQRWLPVHVLRDWRQQHHHHSHLQGLSSDQESYAESTDGWSSANCSTLPPPMNKIPADRYRAPLVLIYLAREHAPVSPQGGRFRGLTMGFPPLSQRSSARRSFGRSKRLSLARSLDDLEVGSYAHIHPVQDMHAATWHLAFRVAGMLRESGHSIIVTFENI